MPLYFDARGEALRFVDEDGVQLSVADPEGLNEKIAATLEERKLMTSTQPMEPFCVAVFSSSPVVYHANNMHEIIYALYPLTPIPPPERKGVMVLKLFHARS